MFRFRHVILVLHDKNKLAGNGSGQQRFPSFWTRFEAPGKKSTIKQVRALHDRRVWSSVKLTWSECVSRCRRHNVRCTFWPGIQIPRWPFPCYNHQRNTPCTPKQTKHNGVKRYRWRRTRPIDNCGLHFWWCRWTNECWSRPERCRTVVRDLKRHKNRYNEADGAFGLERYSQRNNILLPSMTLACSCVLPVVSSMSFSSLTNLGWQTSGR